MTKLGLDGDPLTLVKTAELASRLGYPSLEAWYGDAQKRTRSNFPKPMRRGVYMLGRVQDWLRAGGFEQGGGNQQNPQASKADPAEKATKGNQSGAQIVSLSPRPEVLARLRAQSAAR